MAFSKILKPNLEALAVLLLISCISISGPTYANEACARLFESAANRIRPLEDLKNKVNKFGVEFKISPYIEQYVIYYGVLFKNEFIGSYKIDVFKNGVNSGGILISGEHHVQTPKTVFTAHIGIRPSVRENGVGAMLYILAARAVYRMGGVLLSTDSPSLMARRTWEKLVDAGWAKEISDPLWTPDLNYRAGKVFVIRQDLLRNGFFDSLDEYFPAFNEIKNLTPPEVPSPDRRHIDVLKLE